MNNYSLASVLQLISSTPFRAFLAMIIGIAFVCFLFGRISGTRFFNIALKLILFALIPNMLEYLLHVFRIAK